MVVHELLHYTFVPNKNLNELLGHIISPLVGLNFLEYRKQHFKHHASKTVAEDPDAYIYLPVVREERWYTRMWVFFAGAIAEFFKKLKKKSFSREGSILSQYSVPIAQVLLLAVFSYFSSPLHYILYWLLPLVTIGLFLNRLRVLIEHGYAFDKTKGSPQTTVNVRCNFFERIIFAPHNFNYHQIHHDYPGIPYYHLPQFYAPQNAEGKHHSYVGMLMRILFK